MKKKLLFSVSYLALTLSANAQITCHLIASDTVGCSPFVVAFTDQSTGYPISFYWNFDNGSTSTTLNPSTTFYDTGYYHVFHRVSNSLYTDSQYLTIHVISPPIPSFTPSSTFAQCPPLPVQFTNQTFGDSLSFNWDFGDGIADTAANPFHIYIYPGDYNVTLTAFHKSCSDILVLSNLIQVKGPIGHFTVSPTMGCAPLTVRFLGSTQFVASSIFSPEPAESLNEVINADYNYHHPGTYNPTYTLTDSFGCTVVYVTDSIQVQTCDTADAIRAVQGDFANGIVIQPNPASNFLKIEGNNFINYEIELFNELGQVLKMEALKSNSELDVTALPNGIYFLKVNYPVNHLVLTKRVVIQR